MITINEQEEQKECVRITITKNSMVTTFEIYQAEDFTDSIAAMGCFRVKKNRSWYPNKKTYWSYEDVCNMLMDAHGFKIDSKQKSVVTGPRGYGKSTVVAIRDNEIQPSLENGQSEIEMIQDYYHGLFPDQPDKVQAQVEWFIDLTKEEKAEVIKGISGHRSGKKQEMDSSSDNWKNKPWNEIQSELKQKMKDDTDRVKAHKEAIQNENILNKDQRNNVDDLPEEWNNQF